MTLHLYKWMEENEIKTVAEAAPHLKELFGIQVKAYEEDLFVLSYNQIDSPKMHPIVMESRGLILDNDGNILCRPFDRFFNYGEALELTEKFDFDYADIYEKVDGSLVKLWCCMGQWYVGTRGTAFAESENYTGTVFEDLIYKAFGVKDNQEFNEILRDDIELNEKFTFIFEYTSPLNRVVTPYAEDKMVLLGIRNNETGEYSMNIDPVANHMEESGLNVRAVRKYSFNSMEDLQHICNNMEDLQEGFVCHDRKNNIRIKLKSPKYVAVHRIKGETIPTPNRIRELVVTNETDEFLAYFPEFEEQFRPYQEVYQMMLNDIGCVFVSASLCETQKQFALVVVKFPYSDVLFKARAKGIHPFEAFNAMTVSKRAKILEAYEQFIA